jgi:hypothetical protein
MPVAVTVKIHRIYPGKSAFVIANPISPMMAQEGVEGEILQSPNGRGLTVFSLNR